MKCLLPVLVDPCHPKELEITEIPIAINSEKWNFLQLQQFETKQTYKNRNYNIPSYLQVSYIQ